MNDRIFMGCDTGGRAGWRREGKMIGLVLDMLSVKCFIGKWILSLEPWESYGLKTWIGSL